MNIQHSAYGVQIWQRGYARKITNFQTETKMCCLRVLQVLALFSYLKGLALGAKRPLGFLCNMAVCHVSLGLLSLQHVTELHTLA